MESKEDGGASALAEESGFAQELQEVKDVTPHHAVATTPTTSTKGMGKHKLPTSEESEQDRPSKVAKKPASEESDQDRPSGAVATELGGGHASFQAVINTLPKAIMDPSLNCAVQLRLECSDQERTIIVAGNSPMNKLDQYISEAFDVGCGQFTSNNLKGATGKGTGFFITRPQEPGKCEESMVCAKRFAKMYFPKKPFVDHKMVKVGHVFRYAEDGSILDQTVRFLNMALPGPDEDKEIYVELEGIMWNKAEDPGCRNTEPLPRIVGWSYEYSRTEAIEKNEKMNDGRQRHAQFIQFAWLTPAQLKHSDDLTRLRPLFPSASSIGGGEAWLWESRLDYGRANLL